MILARRWHDHVGCHRARHVEGAGDVGVEHVPQILVLEAGQQIVADDAGIVDQHVDAAAALGDRARRRRARRGVADVDLFGA